MIYYQSISSLPLHMTDVPDSLLHNLAFNKNMHTNDLYLLIKLIQAYTIGGGGGPGGELLKIGGLLVRITSTKKVLFKASFGTSCTA